MSHRTDIHDTLPVDDFPTHSTTESCSARPNATVNSDLPPRPPHFPEFSLDFTSQQWSLMARPHNRKRHCADEPSHQDDSPTNGRKRQRTDESSHQDNHPTKEPSWQYPPEFWDGLSKIPLIHNAVEELERRTCTRPSFPSPPTELAQDLTLAATRELARFARHGGPDLRDLRGYPPATSSHQPAGAMSSSSRSRATKSTDPTTLPTTSGTTTTKKSTTPYNRGFEQHLTDHGVHPIYSSQEPDLEEVMTAMAVPRPSLSPSRFSDRAFKTFRESNARAKDEDDILADVIPTITGPRQANHPSSRNTVFGNLKPLTDGTIAPAKPDIYYGAYPERLDRSIRDELAGHIIPSTMQDKPMAPNLFMEVKGPDGSLAVAMRQARYDGAIGSRAMHSLQNYNEEEPAYDGNPYTFSSIYHGGQLQLYAHHVTAPTTPEGRPEYHMTQVDTWGMTGNIDSFRRGATAFRNARDLAKQHRDNVIREANARASQASVAAAQADATELHEDEISTPHESHEFHEPVDPAHHIALQDADGELQQHITETSFYDFEDDDEAPPVFHYLYTEDDSQEASQEPVAPGDDPSMSFTSSFTSGFSADQSRSKRSRPSLSPPSKSSGSHVSKSRTRPSAARRTAESSTSAAGSVQSGPSGSHWVGTYGRRGKVCFRNLKGLEVKTELKDWTEQIVNELECFYWEDSESGQTFWATELPKETKKRSGRH
ncbi:hypothetical protein QQZ08_009514 [Neonectria magnoliae]|uniref:DUF7924 domain-containing protein n=1 Tax=Neonectria magnoliae TaxID=2732573 RepID=A0ABR1HNP2_9HYPO